MKIYTCDFAPGERVFFKADQERVEHEVRTVYFSNSKYPWVRLYNSTGAIEEYPEYLLAHTRDDDDTAHVYHFTWGIGDWVTFGLLKAHGVITAISVGKYSTFVKIFNVEVGRYFFADMEMLETHTPTDEQRRVYENLPNN